MYALEYHIGFIVVYKQFSSGIQEQWIGIKYGTK
jgi:hypothetical protein